MVEMGGSDVLESDPMPWWVILRLWVRTQPQWAMLGSGSGISADGFATEPEVDAFSEFPCEEEGDESAEVDGDSASAGEPWIASGEGGAGDG